MNDQSSYEDLRRRIRGIERFCSQNADKELKLSEETFRASFEASDVGMALVNEKGRFLSVNKSACRILGRSREALLNSTFIEVTHPDDLKISTELFKKGIEENKPYSIEKRYVTEGNQIRWCLVTVTPVSDADNRFLYAIVHLQDITSSKQAEASQLLLTEILQILNRGDDFRTLITMTLDAIRSAAGFDAVGLRLRREEDFPYYEYGGFSHEFVLEENFLCKRGGTGEVIRGSDGKAVLECTCGLVLSGRTDPVAPFFTEAGSFWTNASHELLQLMPEDDPRDNPRNRCIHSGYESVGLFPIRSGREIIGLLQLNDSRPGRFTPELVAFYENLSQNIGLAVQRSASDQSMRKSEERYRLLVEQAVDGIFVWDVKGNCLDVNSAGCAMFGYSMPEMLDRTFFDVLAKDEVSRLASELNAFTGGQNLRSEWRFRRKDGSHFFGELVGRQLPDGRLQTILRDITERKNAEQELLAAQLKLQQLNDSLESQVAERTEVAETRARQLQALALQLSEAENRERERLARLLHDDLQQHLAAVRLKLGMIDCSSSGGFESEKMLGNCVDLLGEALQKTRRLSHDLSPPELHRKGLLASLDALADKTRNDYHLEVSLNQSSEAEPESKAVAIFLYQAIKELLFNVVKHSDTQSANVDVREKDGWIVVRVADSGQGADLDRVYARRGVEPGFGLFSIEERICSLGGRMTIDTCPGAGWITTMFVPKVGGVHTAPPALAQSGRKPDRAGEEKTPTTGPAPPLAEDDRIRILIVDDHTVMREGLSSLLDSQKGLRVIGQAQDGQEAVTLAGNILPDVVLMDVNMPKMDGIKATCRIVADYPEIAVIGLSMYEDASTCRDMIEAGAVSLLCKSDPIDHIIRAVREAGGPKTLEAQPKGPTSRGRTP